MTAVLSQCGTHRYRLDRDVQEQGIVIAYFGINPSTADATEDDATVRKWRGFTLRNGGRKFIVGNLFSFRATDVKELGRHPTHTLFGDEYEEHIQAIISEADMLVPCWGSMDKPPMHLRGSGAVMMNRMLSAKKPTYVFGITKSFDPKHPLMLGYDTQLSKIA